VIGFIGSVSNTSEDSARDRRLFERGLLLNREQPDFAVRPLEGRLQELFGAYERIDEASGQVLAVAFLKPIFARASLDPEAMRVLKTLRDLGVKTAIVSNTPWGSSAAAWLTRHGLLDQVDATVFCMDVGWRKPHRAPFDRALSLLEVAPADALFVGDDHRWDVIGAQNAGLRPILVGRGVPNSPPNCVTIQNLGDLIELAAETR
jgi:putative hydrolase of the HAD superfamily